MKRALFFIFLIFYAAGLFAQANDSTRIQTRYDSLVKTGDKLLASGECMAAKNCYSQATKLKPGEKYPMEQVARIEAYQKELQEDGPGNSNPCGDVWRNKYNDLIKKGDAWLKAKDYFAAIAAYQEALAVKPGERYPLDQIRVCEEEIRKMTLDMKYGSLKTNADSLFASKRYAEAKQMYQQALTLKPNESYPKEMIARCDYEISGPHDDNQHGKYKEALLKADDYFENKKYEDARKKYQEALRLMPGDQYCIDKIKQIDLLLEQ